MAQICEVFMLVCFGLSWPANISKSLRSRTAKGKSVAFEVMVLLGYLVGVTGKFIGGNVNYVVAVYFLDMLMVSIDLMLTIRNIHLDRLRERQAAEQAG